jgi:mannose/fructose/sorbose-specific phosphotransferase system IIA component
MAEVPLVLVGHGGYPAGVRDAVEMILGRQDGVATVSLPPDGSTEQVADAVRTALAELGGSGGALVLADLTGGSPSNAVGALALADPALQLVAGLNLPMALEVLTSPETDAAALAAVAADAGSRGVSDVGASLRAAAST